MELFKAKFTEFAQYYNSDIKSVFKSDNYLANEKWYKQLLIDVLGQIFKKENIQNGKFAEQLMLLIKHKLDYRQIIGEEKFEFYQSRKMTSGEDLKPWKSFFNLLSGTFQIWANLRILLENRQAETLSPYFFNLLYSDKPLTERIDTFQEKITKFYGELFKERKMGKASKAPVIPLNLIAIFLACSNPDKYYFYKAFSYLATAEMLEMEFDRSRSAGTTYVEVLRFADLVKEKSIKLYGPDVDNVDTQSFIFMLPEITDVGNEAPEAEPVLPEDDFFSESHLENYILAHWKEIGEFDEYEIVKGSAKSGGQFPTDVGIIDILAKHKNKNEWLVVELKAREGRSGDDAVGQLLRYMGFIKENKVQDGGKVRGFLITGKEDKKVKIAVSVTQNIEYKIYSVKIAYENFKLRAIEKKD